MGECVKMTENSLVINSFEGTAFRKNMTVKFLHLLDISLFYCKLIPGIAIKKVKED